MLSEFESRACINCEISGEHIHHTADTFRDPDAAIAFPNSNADDTHATRTIGTSKPVLLCLSDILDLSQFLPVSLYRY